MPPAVGDFTAASINFSTTSSFTSLSIKEKYKVRGIIPIGYIRDDVEIKRISPKVDLSRIAHIEKFNKNNE